MKHLLWEKNKSVPNFEENYFCRKNFKIILNEGVSVMSCTELLQDRI